MERRFTTLRERIYLRVLWGDHWEWGVYKEEHLILILVLYIGLLAKGASSQFLCVKSPIYMHGTVNSSILSKDLWEVTELKTFDAPRGLSWCYICS